MDEGTPIERFYDSICQILDDLAHLRFNGRIFTFTMDSLNLYKKLILNMIHNSGHQYIFCTPHWPMDGTVEYVFNTMQTRMTVFLNQPTTTDGF